MMYPSSTFSSDIRILIAMSSGLTETLVPVGLFLYKFRLQATKHCIQISLPDYSAGSMEMH